MVHGVDGVEWRSRLVPEWIAPAIPNGPKSERKAVGRLRFVARHLSIFLDLAERDKIRL
jgi:hypothetical protein